jgi:hypothetical protein
MFAEYVNENLTSKEGSVAISLIWRNVLGEVERKLKSRCQIMEGHAEYSGLDQTVLNIQPLLVPGQRMTQ